MNAGMQAVLTDNLKTLRLSTMIRNLEGHLRQAKQDQIEYDEFLLNLTEIEVQVRKENGRKRRIREARFPLLKPLETFNFEAAADLDARVIRDLSNCDYVKKGRNVIFMGKSGTGNYVKFLLM
jgi:DNA replication protein DnaC